MDSNQLQEGSVLGPALVLRFCLIKLELISCEQMAGNCLASAVFDVMWTSNLKVANNRLLAHCYLHSFGQNTFLVLTRVFRTSSYQQLEKCVQLV